MKIARATGKSARTTSKIARAASAVAPQRGVTLVEVVAFIVIVGVAFLALLTMFRNVLPRGATPQEIFEATHLAQERMELILGRRDRYGYSTSVLADPCVGVSLPANCSDQYTPSGLYSVIVVGINPVSTWSSGYATSAVRIVGVRVLGPDGNTYAELSSVIANY